MSDTLPVPVAWRSAYGMVQGRRLKIFQRGGNEKKDRKLAKNSTICVFRGGGGGKGKKIEK